MPPLKRHHDGSYLSWPIWLTYLLLFALGVPWYWPAGDTTLWLGMPAWVVVAIGVSAVISLFTAWLLRRPWPGEGGGTDG